MSDSGTNARCSLGLKLLHILCTVAGQSEGNSEVLPYCVCIVNKLSYNTTKERHQFVAVLQSCSESCCVTE